MKTSELIGPALDWAVAKYEVGSDDGWDDSFIPYHKDGEHNYSTDWAQGGPLIEQEKITLMYCEGEFIAGTNPECFENKVFMYHKQYGPTPLIAAMRCYVALKLGDEVEIPEGLK